MHRTISVLTQAQLLWAADLNMREDLLEAGIYRIYDAKRKIAYIGYSYNLTGILKRFRFELNLNMCTLKPLQTMFNESGKTAAMDVLERLNVKPNDDGSEAIMQAALEKWQAALTAQGDTVKVILL